MYDFNTLLSWLTRYFAQMGAQGSNPYGDPRAMLPGYPGQSQPPSWGNPGYSQYPLHPGNTGNYTIGQNPVPRDRYAPPPNMAGGGSNFNPFPGGGGSAGESHGAGGGYSGGSAGGGGYSGGSAGGGGYGGDGQTNWMDYPPRQPLGRNPGGGQTNWMDYPQRSPGGGGGVVGTPSGHGGGDYVMGDNPTPRMPLR